MEERRRETKETGGMEDGGMEDGTWKLRSAFSNALGVYWSGCRMVRRCFTGGSRVVKQWCWSG